MGAPKPKPMSPAEANAATIRMVDRIVREGVKPQPVAKPAGAPKPTGGHR